MTDDNGSTKYGMVCEVPADWWRYSPEELQQWADNRAREKGEKTAAEKSAERIAKYVEDRELRVWEAFLGVRPVKDFKPTKSINLLDNAKAAEQADEPSIVERQLEGPGN